MLTMVDDRNRGFALGASDYVTKPVDRDRLSTILKKYAARPCPVLLVDEDDRAPRVCGAFWKRKAGQSSRPRTDVPRSSCMRSGRRA